MSNALSFGVFYPEDIKIVQAVFAKISRQLWFSSDPQMHVEFGRYVLRMYARGLVLPEKLEVACYLAAQKHFSVGGVADMSGRCILIVEDEYLIAREASRELQALGAEIVGPVGSVSRALEALEDPKIQVDAAMLDIALAGEMVFPVAALLKMKRIPFVFVSGYDERKIPPSYRNTPTYEKPANWASIAAFLARQPTPPRP